MSRRTTLASWAGAIAAALRARGGAPEPLFAAAGLDITATRIPGARFPVAGMTRLWQLAVARSGDPAFGLQVPPHIQPATMHVLGPALQASPTLGDALLRMARYSRLVTDGAGLQLEQHDDDVGVVFVPPEAPVVYAEAAFEAFMAAIAQLMRVMAGPQAVPLRCELHRAAPSDASVYERSFACPVQFGQARRRLLYARPLLQRPLPDRNPAQAQQLEADAAQQLARFDATPVSRRVREWLGQHLPAGEPGRETVAAALHLTPRTLLRRLAAENVHYKALLNETRCELAFAYLRQGLGGAEITYLLDFTDPANFTRAFRRWTGQTPQQWRAQQT